MYRDDETGLSYSVYRYYSPELGRFVTEDPLGAWGDPYSVGNAYAFLGNQYRSAFDRLGLLVQAEAKGCCGRRTVLFIHDRRAWKTWKDYTGLGEEEYWREDQRVAEALTSQLHFDREAATTRAALKGFDVKRFDLHKFPEGPGKSTARENSRVRREIRWAAEDPCVVGIIGWTHGMVSVGGVLTINGKVILSPSMIHHTLLFFGSTACGSAGEWPVGNPEEDSVAPDKEVFWGPHTDTPDGVPEGGVGGQSVGSSIREVIERHR
jgi:RHS repeat-associated protein